MTAGMPRIVVMEDNPSDVLLIREALREQELQASLIVLNDGEAALDWVAERQDEGADLILLDLNLPRHNGQEVLRAVRSQPLLNGVPVVVFSSSDSAGDREEVRRLGADRFLVKPCGLDEFLAVGRDIKELLQSGHRAAAG